MTLGTFNFWTWGKPKPLSARGTKLAFDAGDRVFKRDGVNPQLKQALKLSIKSARRRRALRGA